eukprot:TRINITY_DN18296_c0_g2_i1.p1 TRINITY_DN18296_c0_g2~~TRINITY_DN18296_c0_g2_i1.p1  ORF type:complete len:826 (+),score=145.44 TRINITY_DN18296_c0_g2_i1:100-2577(+)
MASGFEGVGTLGLANEFHSFHSFDDLIAGLRYEYENLVARCKASNTSEAATWQLESCAAEGGEPGAVIGSSSPKCDGSTHGFIKEVDAGDLLATRPVQPAHELPDDLDCLDVSMELDKIIVDMPDTRGEDLVSRKARKVRTVDTLKSYGGCVMFDSENDNEKSEQSTDETRLSQNVDDDFESADGPPQSSRARFSLRSSSGFSNTKSVQSVSTWSMMTDDKLQKLKYIFQKIDANADGRISASEIHDALVKGGVIQSTVQGLRKSFLVLKSKEVEEGEPSSWDTSELDVSLAFPEFAELILQPSKRVKEMPERVAADFTLIRNLVIREDAKERLQDLFAQAHGASTLAGTPQRSGLRMQIYDKLDTFMALIIIINTITLGWGTDSDSKFFKDLELVFNGLYFVEFIIKLCALGTVDFFFGPQCTWHWFDAFLCVFAAMDVLLHLAAQVEGNANNSLLQILRLVRLVRLQRIVRLLKYRMFSELTLMVKGVAAGFRTLFWAIVLLFFVIYVFSLVLRQTLSEDITDCIEGADTCSETLQTGLARFVAPQHLRILVGSVPNTMFTIFRCVNGDCDTPRGTPFLTALQKEYGVLFIAPYCVAFLFVIFGLFNMIVAIFVETVMEAARQKRRMALDQEALQVGHKLQRLLVKFLKVDVEEHTPDMSCFQILMHKIGQAVPMIGRRWNRQGFGDYGPSEFDTKITRADFAQVLKDAEVKRILDDLDIGSGDRSEFFDVIDADGSGELDIHELIVGLLKLRGGADKSDVVAALLGVRSIQRSFKVHVDQLDKQYTTMRAHQAEIMRRLAKMKRQQDFLESDVATSMRRSVS